MTSSKAAPGIWVGQLFHFVWLMILLALVCVAWKRLGEPFPGAFWVAVAVPVLHQVFVWLAWRLQLLRSTTSNHLTFRGYVACFFVLFAGRFISLLTLAWLDRGSLELMKPLQVVAAILLTLLGVYAMYSVGRYFGMARAAGADHFDLRYRDMPPVKDGIFRFTNNGMYVYAFLLFWAIALGFNSAAALAVAAFSHAYIWVHFHATEKPDMEFLYAAKWKSS